MEKLSYLNFSITSTRICLYLFKKPTSISTIQQKFTEICILLNVFLIISNPDTYICGSTNSYSSISSKRYNDEISCDILLPSYHDNGGIHFEMKCFIDITDDDNYIKGEYLYELFHCKARGKKKNESVNSLKSDRYHSYYHYDLEKSLQTSYYVHTNNLINDIMTWSNQLSWNQMWELIPNSLKRYGAFIISLDTAFCLVIKLLVLRDNYKFKRTVHDML